MTMQKKTLATAAVASTLGGALAGATFLAPGLAGAQDDTDTTDDTTGESVEESTVASEAGTRIAEALQGLVDDGTLTQAQLDAVVDTLVEARPEGRFRGHRGGFPVTSDLTEILGLEPSELRAALADGQTLADVAAEQGVDTQDLVDALVDAAEERVATGLENGRIDQEQADELLADAGTRADEIVNGEFEFEGRRGHRGRFGQGGPSAEADTETDAETDADGDA